LLLAAAAAATGLLAVAVALAVCLKGQLFCLVAQHTQSQLARVALHSHQLPLEVTQEVILFLMFTLQ
jgi:hypothetical protein